MTIFLCLLAFDAGFAAAWFGKDTLLLWFKGASAVAADLRVKAAKVEATIKAL
jgi:hypothetical protein